MERQAKFEGIEGAEPRIRCSGDWTFATARALEAELAQLATPAAQASQVNLDISGIEKLDTVGASLLTQLRRNLGKSAQFVGGSELHTRLLDRVDQAEPPQPMPRQGPSFLMQPFVSMGKLVFGAADDVASASGVQGRILAAFGRTITFQAPLRFPAFVHQFEQIVLRAIPIVALISVVVGAIITQQTILQLRTFGAVIFVVDLAAILMFREIGVLLAAIMVAGRSGSAITAEIGAMRMREEFDALRVMGVDPYQALVMPRVLALVLGLPLLAFIGSMAGLLGAAIVARFYGDIPFDVFIERLRGAMTTTSVAVGMLKAPVMAFLIGLIASIEGMKVQGSSESLGRHTTSSVVKAIFVVIVVDGLFAVFFAAIGF